MSDGPVPDRLDNLSRREVLAAATGTGVAGAIAAGSTGAAVSDTADFSANTQSAGALDLTLCWETDDGPCEPTDGSRLSIDLGDVSRGDSGRGVIRLRLPDDGTNNPAWVWLRSTCPRGACGIYHKMQVTLRYDADCDGPDGADSPLIEGTNGNEQLRLCDALQQLSAGVRIDGQPGTTGIQPLSPGQDLCLGFEWRITEELCGIDHESAAELEFVARQRRHDAEPTAPWPARRCAVECDADCRDTCYPGSFVALCVEDAGDDPLTRHDVEALSWTPETVRWATSRPIDWVVLKHGLAYDLYDPGDGATSGSITRGEHRISDERVETLDVEPSAPCPDVDDERDPCGVKYEFEGENWEQVCPPPSTPEQGGEQS